MPTRYAPETDDPKRIAALRAKYRAEGLIYVRTYKVRAHLRSLPERVRDAARKIRTAVGA